MTRRARIPKHGKTGIIEYPTQLHQHIDLLSDICLHYLLTRMDKSINQVELDITAHCNSGMACDGELAEPRGHRTRFPCIVGVNGVGRSFNTQIMKTLLHPVITVPCDCAMALAPEPQLRDHYDRAITVTHGQPGYNPVCTSTADITSQLLEDSLPPLLTVVIRDPAANPQPDAYHALPSIPATLVLQLPSGAHATYCLLNVARHNRTNHFDNVLSLPAPGAMEPVRVRVDARIATRTMPCQPGSNPVPAYVGASAWYLKMDD